MASMETEALVKCKVPILSLTKDKIYGHMIQAQRLKNFVVAFSAFRSYTAVVSYLHL